MTAIANRPPTPIPVAAAGATWLGAWLVGQLLVVAAITVAGVEPGDPITLGVLLASSSLSWSAFVAGLMVLQRRVTAPPYTFASFRSLFRLEFRTIDLLGVPLGIATQVVLIPLLYWPLRSVWTDTFTNKALEKRAEEIVDAASGALVVVLALLLVVGAPLVEELVYRGLIQRSLVGRVGRVAGVVLAAAFFGAIHFAPVELPGLITAGLVFGLCAALTGRIGMSIVAHAAFNATALAVITVLD